MTDIEKLVKTYGAMTFTSGSAKEFVLKQNDTPLLRQVLLYAYNPLWSYGVKEVGERQVPGEQAVRRELPMAVSHFFFVLDALRARTYTGNDARCRLDLALDDVWVSRPDVAHILKLIIARDLDFGAGVTTINKVFPGLIPTFECSLAKDYEERKATWPMLGEVKYDGKRVLAVIQGGAVTLYSRNGRVETKYQHIRDQLTDWATSGPRINDCVVDGELMWGMFGSRSGAEADAKFVVYDFISMDKWVSHGRTADQSDRSIFVQAHFRPYHQWPQLVASESRMLASYAEAQAFYAEVVASGGEGIMLKDPRAPYAFKRGHHWMKMKPVLDADVKIVDVEEGKGKYACMLGAIIVDHKGVRVNVGSGFTDADRAALWEDLGSGLIGQIAEVRYTEVTPDGSLRFPRFVRLRDDK